MERLLLKPQFIDRAGRTVFQIHIDSGKGEVIGQIRLQRGHPAVELEWLDECEAGEES